MNKVFTQPSVFSRRFPQTRMRRLRRHGWIRELVQEHRLHPSDLIWPVFVQEGKKNRTDIPSLPGVERLTIDYLVDDLKKAADLGIQAIALFPATPPEIKTDDGTEALNPDNLVCRTIQAIKTALPDLGVITDVALDPYTSHGHDGILRDGYVVNDETAEVLAGQAVVQAQAGADVVAPSDMMDGRIGIIRNALEHHGLYDTLILSYAAKYASVFYGPFRDAVGSSTALCGNKKSYQMNPANTHEAMHEVSLDLQEGADMIMVKPGLPYLDVVHRVKQTFGVPTFAYHVSGEYAMLRAASDRGWLDYEAALLETILSFKRAGCDGIFTYGALDAIRFISP